MTEPPPRGGRPRVGDAARELPDGRTASYQYGIVLADGQREQLADVGARLAMSGGALIRRAAERLARGDIKLPTAAKDVPPGAGSQRSVVLPHETVEQIIERASKVRETILVPRPTTKKAPARRGRPADPNTQKRDALIRYAIAVDLANEETALDAGAQ